MPDTSVELLRSGVRVRAPAANVVAVEDPAKNKKYDKSRSTGRIDGIIASVMACGIIEQAELSGYEIRVARNEDVIRSI